MLVYSLCIAENQSILDEFYDLANSLDSKKCPDHTYLMPECTHCIPGLIKSKGSETCGTLSPLAARLRNQIEKLTIERFGKNPDPKRKYGLYPYLEKSEFLFRQQKFGSMLEKSKPRHIIDIGSYYNPINLFIGSHCPESVVIVEPILDALSAHVPCPPKQSSGAVKTYTHVIILPIPFSYYMKTKKYLPVPDTVVCIGCDGMFGPSRRMLDTAFQRPYTLYMEYPEKYYHDQAFNKMLGDGPGEKMIMEERNILKTNQTQYVDRMMKIIQYS